MQFSLLNLFRFFAALIVVLYHFAYDIPPFDEGVLNRWIGNGHFPVTFFFVLSAFVMVYSNINRDFTEKETRFQFWKKRAIRLLPLYYIALGSSVFFEYMVEHPIFAPELLLNTIGIQAWQIHPDPILNPPAWSLSVEFFFYLLTPLLLIKIGKLKEKQRSIMSLLFWMATLFVFSMLTDSLEGKQSMFLFFPLLHLSSFLIGIQTGYIWLNHKENMKLKFTDLLLTSIAILTILCVINDSFFHSLHIDVLAPSFAIIIFISVKFEAGLRIKLPTKTFNFLGDLSYPIYILHWPFTYYFKSILPSDGTSSWLMTYLACLLLICTIVYLTIDRFFKKLYSKA